MKATDYLKRSFSAVFHEDKIFRTFGASIVTAGAMAFGYINAMYEEAETTSTAATATVQKEARNAYLTEIQTFKAPEIAGAQGWSKLDDKMKNFSERVVLDARLSETDAASIISDFKASTRFRPPQYLWMTDHKGDKGRDVIPDMNYLNECRTTSSSVDASLRAESVYKCAIDKENSNEVASVLPGAIGGMISMFGLLIGGGAVGRRWERDFDDKKREEEWEKRRRERAAEDAKKPVVAKVVVEVQAPTPEPVREPEKKAKTPPKLKLD